jgi:hypothetical protein
MILASNSCCMAACTLSEIDVHKKWMCCMPLLLLFHLPFNLYSNTLARRTSNCADAKGSGPGGQYRVWYERNLHLGEP